MSRHRPDLVMCLRTPGVSPGLLCDKCEGRCPVCDSSVHPKVPVRVCDECAFGRAQCIVCHAPASNQAYYCRECAMLEKDRDGCPNILNLGSTRTDVYFDRAQKQPTLEH